MPNHAKQVLAPGRSPRRATGRGRLLALVFAAFTSAAAVGAGPPAAVSAETDFSYHEWTANEGSKSAGARGTLQFKGSPINLDVPVRIKTPIGSFYHAISALAWEPQGWFRVDDIPIGESVAPFAATDLRKGSYVGARRAGTPAHWCYVPEMDTWFDPLQLTH